MQQKFFNQKFLKLTELDSDVRPRAAQVYGIIHSFTVQSKGVQSWLDSVNPFVQKWSNPAVQVAVNIDLRKAAK